MENELNQGPVRSRVRYVMAAGLVALLVFRLMRNTGESEKPVDTVFGMACFTDADEARLDRILTQQPELANQRYPDSRRFSACPLDSAAQMDSPRGVRVLLKHGADPYSTDSQGLTPIHYAAWRESLQALDEFAKQGVDFNFLPAETEWRSESPRRISALDYAAMHRQEKSVRFLLEHRAKIDGQPPQTSFSALHCAMMHLYEPLSQTGSPRDRLYWLERLGVPDNSEVIELLLQSGADLANRNFQGDQPLHVAIKERQLATLEYLFKAHGNRLDVNAIGQNGELPLRMALHRLSYEKGVDSKHIGDAISVLRLLIEHGAAKDARSGNPPQTAYEFAVARTLPDEALAIVKP